MSLAYEENMREAHEIMYQIYSYTMKSVQAYAITRAVLNAMVMLPVSILLKTKSTKKLTRFSVITMNKRQLYIYY